MREPCTLETRGVALDRREGNLLHSAQDLPTKLLIRFLNYLTASVQFYSPQVRHFAQRISSTSARYTLAERLLFSVLTMLISCAIFLTSFIFAILAGSIVILMFSLAALVKFGRRMHAFGRSTLERFTA